jgi:hypothetical protein
MELDFWFVAADMLGVELSRFKDGMKEAVVDGTVKDVPDGRAP